MPCPNQPATKSILHPMLLMFGQYFCDIKFITITKKIMAEIRHNVVIKATPDKIYKAITTQEGLANWWAKQTTAKPQIGFLNTFTFGNSETK